MIIMVVGNIILTYERSMPIFEHHMNESQFLKGMQLSNTDQRI